MEEELRIHIFPTHDLKEHLTDGDDICSCMPKYTTLKDGSILIVHNSWDGREHFENKRSKNELPL
jgi:hypothetical protein